MSTSVSMRNIQGSIVVNGSGRSTSAANGQTSLVAPSIGFGVVNINQIDIVFVWKKASP
jgi:hypothetical protein